MRDGNGQLGSVLLIDDDPTILSAYSRVLSAAGFAVQSSSSAQSAVEVVKSGGAFDAIVSDVTMPGMSGLEFLSAVRDYDSAVPVLLVTGAPDVQGAALAVERGAFRYLTKPIDVASFVQNVRKATEVSRDARAQRASRCAVCNESCGSKPCARLVRGMSALNIVFQPIVSWKDRRVFGYEALVRCSEPGLQRPDQLFSAAETAEAVPLLGRRIRERIVQSATSLPDGVALFVNIHPLDILDDELYDETKPLSTIASRVILEITERSSLSAVDDVPERMARLRSLGYRIAIDDLGAGYAGLSSFSLLEPGVVKIDMSLVRGIDKSDKKQRMLRSLRSLCGKDLGLDVVCEGIETAEERDVVLALGCDLLQGYFFAKPGPAFPAVAEQSFASMPPKAAE